MIRWEIMAPLRYFVLLLLFGAGTVSASGISLDLLPRQKDHTSMWWRDGYPGVVEDAAWRRVIQTGHYWFLFDTDQVKIPRFGSAEVPLSELSGAELELRMVVNGKVYRCFGSEEPTRFTGARLIESGRFLQRADVTNLRFRSEEGERLNVEARLETVAWPDQLGLILAARPGMLPIQAGEGSYGRVNGGFGLTGSNELKIPATGWKGAPAFTLEFWMFLPQNFVAGRHFPWLVCKGPHEAADGAFGITLDRDGVPTAILNAGGGGGNAVRVRSRQALRFGAWNHLAMSFDGTLMRLYANGQFVGESEVTRPWPLVPGDITFGNRGDGLGEGDFRFRGIVDEVQFFDRALSLGQLRHLQARPEEKLPHLSPTGRWLFRTDLEASLTRKSESWEAAAMELRLAKGEETLESRWTLPDGQSWTAPSWNEISLMVNPATFQKAAGPERISVGAEGYPGGELCPVIIDQAIGWHRVNLDEVEPLIPGGAGDQRNDALERVRLVLSNASNREQVARLMFEKTRFQHRHGFPITGITAVLRDGKGEPTGIPVQLSKNWHRHPRDPGVYSGQWFHGISQVRLPPGARVELELVLAYGHWGGIPAASHSQLSLIGWGGNQRWDQSALGSWGESICFDPEQAQAKCSITDVRPFLVTSTRDGEPRWGWTTNVGGGDFFRLFLPDGKRAAHTAMRADYQRQGPCLTEVSYSGGIGRTGLFHRETVSLSRSNDYLCGTYRIELRVQEPVEFSRFVLFQIGADTYFNGRERKIAYGDENGLLREWDAVGGGNAYRGSPLEGGGQIPWISLHDSERAEGQPVGAWASRGIVIRSWKARLGGRPAGPWVAERGVEQGPKSSSIVDLVVPPGVARLEPGDFLVATIEHVVQPQSASDYYGPDDQFRKALAEDGNRWQLMHRHAVGDHREVQVLEGALERLYPDIRVETEADRAGFLLKGGVGFVPVTFRNLSSHQGYLLTVNGLPVDQSVHGNDYWQTDFDVVSRSWSRTYNLPAGDGGAKTIELRPNPAR